MGLKTTNPYNIGFFCIILCQGDFSSRLKVTCSNTDGAKKSRRWRFNRPTWPDLKDPSRPKSTYSTRLPRLKDTRALQTKCSLVTEIL